MFKYTNIFSKTTINFFLGVFLFLIIYSYGTNPHYLSNSLHLKYTNNNYSSLFHCVLLSIILTLILIIVINRKTISSYIYVIVVFLMFTTVIFFLIYTNSTIVFFIMYEMLLILTSIIVYFNSPNIRSRSITFYFLFWTQLSSFFLWLAITAIYLKTNTYLFNELTLSKFNKTDCNVIKYLLLVSFSIKLPLWPFSFWLLKTHVEANTSFSIFLSGVLVKTSLIGLIKFSIFFINTDCTLIFVLTFVSIITTTFSLNNQIDFKKLIAYTTIQEMSIIVMFIFFNSYNNLNILVYFIILHTLTSILLFLLNDSIYIRYKTRRTKLHLGLYYTSPKLNTVLLLIWVFFISLPLSSKFIFEVVILMKFMSLPNIIIISILVCLQLFTLIFVTINVITYSFGNANKPTYDLTKIELVIYIIIFTGLISLLF